MTVFFKSFSLKKYSYFFTMFVMIAVVSCERSYRIVQVAVDSFNLKATMYARNGTLHQVLLHKGDELTYLDSHRDVVGGRLLLVEYQGVRGYIDQQYVSFMSKNVTKTGKETSPSSSREMPFGNAILMIIGFSIFSLLAFGVGYILSLIPVIGKFLFALIVLAIIGIWIYTIVDFVKSGAILEVVFVGVFLLVGLIIGGPTIVGRITIDIYK